MATRIEDEEEAREYFEDDGREPISTEKVDEVLSAWDEITGTPGEYERRKQSVLGGAEEQVKQAAVKDNGGKYTPPETPVSQAPVHGLMAVRPAYRPVSKARAAEQQAANEERAKQAEARARERNAQAAAREAQDAKRQELLASGQYYDDGRGNIKLRKKFMMRDPKRGTFYDNMAWQTALDIQNAGREAYDRVMQSQEAAASAAKTQDVVAMNKAALEEKKAQAAEQVSNKAKGYLSIYDGMVAALQAMNDGEIQDEEKTVWGGKDENGRDARWKYDANGRIIGQADARQEKTGRRFKTGFVAQDVIDAINSNLQMRGNRDFKITGIMAKQGVDAIDNMTGEPMFYVQGLRADGQKFMRKMSAKDVYRFGVENGERSGLSRDEAEANVIEGIGDLFGNGKRMSAPSEKERIAAEEIASKERIAKMKNDTDKEIAAMGGNAGRGGKQGYTLEEKLKIIEAETERQLKVAKAKKEGGEQVQAIKTYAQLLKDPALRARLEKLGDEDANKFVETLTAVMGLGENAGAQSQEENSGASTGAQRSVAEIRANPQDGDELPLKGGGKARYNGKTGKWEAAN